jgi:hypothetical protein
VEKDKSRIGKVKLLDL